MLNYVGMRIPTPLVMQKRHCRKILGMNVGVLSYQIKTFDLMGVLLEIRELRKLLGSSGKYVITSLVEVMKAWQNNIHTAQMVPTHSAGIRIKFYNETEKRTKT